MLKKSVLAGQPNMEGRPYLEEIVFSEIPNVYVLEDKEIFYQHVSNPSYMYSTY